MLHFEIAASLWQENNLHDSILVMTHLISVK
jgi:hypothetical protein